MSNDIATTQQHQVAPFGQRRELSGVNAGAVSIEAERAIAEVQGQIVVAKRFPRDLNAAHAELMIACKSKSFAETAFYNVPNRGSGPSIRMAEEIARVCGNFQYGHRELGRTQATATEPGKSEVEVFAWDVEKNNRSARQITVLHVTDTKNGPKRLTDQTDIDNRIANVASKQARGRILGLSPKWLVADAIAECRKTLAGDNSEPIEVRVRRMTQAFAQFGVNAERLTAYLKHGLDSVTGDELIDLTGLFNALKDGTPASELFPLEEGGEQSTAAADALAEAARKGAVAKAEKAATKKVEEPKPAAAEAAKTDPEPSATAEKAAPVQERKSAQKASKTVEEKAAQPAAQEQPAVDESRGDAVDRSPKSEDDFF